MTSREPVGIRRLEAIHYYVHDLDRSRRFYTGALDFAETAVSDDALAARGKQKSVIFEAGAVRVLVSQPVGEGGRAWRWLQKHPDGVGTLIFEVEDAAHTLRVLESRGATPISDVIETKDDLGTFKTFSITTPFGGSTFRFVQRDRYDGTYPGMKKHATPQGGKNAFGFLGIDHITSNFETMSPALLWMEHVMGFERFWDIQFHTNDVAGERESGSGLKSTVMWDRKSGAKFANNEPKRPFFRASQINLFHEDQKGDGIQHAALGVKDIIPAVRGLRERGVRFMPTPGTYYDMLPQRLEETGVKEIDEKSDILRELEILVDGEGLKKYLLQIFLQDSAGLYGEREAGPFFYEIIQRKGSQGFGGGNFRALFESIERQHKMEGRI
ncbi:4-hydroxyphenylpyruvate dioxygenase family protein [Sandaracinus amylolyticus]|uniref:4-hydroxyphenylpyruvate dioxygenase n=1 Tax=Sandaracinus amylolyticus TaxID=927083 RepID=A0A0F6YJF4_9BACT|nr:VOC family protein [Sandaracinus amylolyticus]AKF08016.1 4-hydroxyphenylpyruvate dioxygenase [Sandaracinus amylolyticus]